MLGADVVKAASVYELAVLPESDSGTESEYRNQVAQTHLFFLSHIEGCSQREAGGVTPLICR